MVKLIESMKTLSREQRKLVADFLVNIAVAWFAAGVIGIFISKSQSIEQIIVSITWGVALSLAFVIAATKVVKT